MLIGTNCSILLQETGELLMASDLAKYQTFGNKKIKLTVVRVPVALSIFSTLALYKNAIILLVFNCYIII